MTRRHVLWMSGVLAIGGLAGAAPPAPLRVMAAASLSDVLPEVARAWRAAGGGEISFSFESTSRLASQLSAGAPADLFISADQAWMDEVSRKGLVRPETRVPLLGNRLVGVAPRSSGRPPTHPRDLATLEGKLALAGEHVPAGRYAREALKGVGVWEAVAPNVVSGDNVRTVLAWVARGEAAAGVVYATDVRVEPRVLQAFSFPEGSHSPIVYPAAVTRSSAQPTEAARLLRFCSGAGRAVFEAAGFPVLTLASP